MEVRPINEIIVPEWRGDLRDRRDENKWSEGIKRLAASIAHNGLLQPLVLMPDNTLVAGLRRLEACKVLGWKKVPVVVGGFKDG